MNDEAGRILNNLDKLRAARAPAEVIDAYVHNCEGRQDAIGGYRGWRKPIDFGECKLTPPQIMAQYSLVAR